MTDPPPDPLHGGCLNCRLFRRLTLAAACLVAALWLVDKLGT
jgi:hypothetical protein